MGTDGPTEKPHGAPVTVLIVDDEPAITRALRRILTGFQVEVVQSGQDALRRLSEGAEFDVILCDLLMPQTSGMQLHAELARSRPELARRMIFMTGGVFSDAACEFLNRVPNPRIEQPFDIDQLRVLIQRMINQIAASRRHRADPA